METNKPARRIIDELEPMGKAEFPITQAKYIRTMCSEMGMVKPGRIYSSKVQREKGVIIVTRMK